MSPMGPGSRRAAVGGRRERTPDHVHHRHCQGDAGGDRGADTAGQVWGDAGAGACGRGVQVREERARVMTWMRTDERPDQLRRMVFCGVNMGGPEHATAI